MHVAERNGDQPAGDAAAGHLDGPRIGSGGTRVGIKLNRDLSFLGASHESRINLRINIGATANDGAAAELGFSVFTWVAIWVIGGMAHIDGEGDLWINRKGGGLGAPDADFFLGGRDRHNFGVQFRFFASQSD